jgi:hypothetical protein
MRACALMLALLACAPYAVRAQAQLPARQLEVSDSTGANAVIANRYLWRDITLLPGAAVRSGAALPMQRGLMLEYEGATAVQDRARDKVGDQYSLGVNYELPFAGPPSGGSLLLGVTGYALPSLRDVPGVPHAPHSRGEVTLGLLHDVRIPSQGIRTIALRADVAHDVTYSHATWLAASASASAGTTIPHGVIEHVVKVIGRVQGSMSNLGSPLVPGPNPNFGYHSVDGTISLDYRRRDPAATSAFSAALDFTEALRADRLGGSTHLIQLRLSALLL